MKNISFCTTCRDRLSQPEAFIRNLFLAQRWDGCEFVLIDYGSTDGLRDFVRGLPAHLSRHLRYYRMEAEAFHMSHAKNVAHVSASGEILVNLDFDNFIHQDYAEFLRETVGDGRIIHNLNGAYRGTFGRIAVTRGDFLCLRGYDESFAPFRFQDVDFLYRADAKGIEVVSSYHGLLPRQAAPFCQAPAASLEHHRDMGQRNKYEAINRLRGADRSRDVNPAVFGAAELTDLSGRLIKVGYPAHG